VTVDLDALLERVGSKYAMVILAARRARQLVNGAPPLVETPYTKPVSIALEELRAGKLEYRTPDGP
jgi:DNA-directed RNA polymerase subunit omega